MVFLKSLYIILICCLLYLFIGNTNTSKINIPDEAIRFRVIASSNSPTDQQLKIKVKLEIEKELAAILKDKKNFLSADTAIYNNMEIIKNKVKTILQKEKNMETFEINYGNNYFPEKNYNGIKYEEGKYNSLTITLGNGLGENWWCILFPPLCLLDENDYDEADYSFYVKEVLDDYLN